MMRPLPMLVCLLLLAGCTDRQDAKAAAEDFGFQDVRVGEWRYPGFRCGRDYNVAYAFRATNMAGRPVKGTVCMGWATGSVVKLDR